MKKLISIFFCLLILTAPAFAVEYLQVDAADDDGVLFYPLSGAIVPKSHDFTLYTLVDLDDKKSQTINDLTQTFYISIALIPKVSELPSDDFDYGSFVFNGEIFEVKSTNLNLQDGPLPSVSELDTFYFEYSFNFQTGDEINDPQESGTAEAYTTLEDWGANLISATSDTLAYAAFDVDMSKLNNEFDLRFDLYTLNPGGNVQFTSSKTHYVQTAPEPGTMLLFGFGLIWMARMSRKKLL